MTVAVVRNAPDQGELSRLWFRRDVASGWGKNDSIGSGVIGGAFHAIIVVIKRK